MPRELSQDVRKKVVEAHQSGKGYMLISKALGLSKTTVRAILRKWKRFGTVMNLPRSGRPSKISPQMRQIIREVQKNPHATSKHVEAALAAANISIPCSTIRKILRVHARPTLVGHPDVMSLRRSSDEEENTCEGNGKLSDSSDGLGKDVKVKNDEHDLVKQNSMNDGRGGVVEEECCEETLGQGNGDPHGAGRASEKKMIDRDVADRDSNDDLIHTFDDDEDGGDGGDNGESCDKETEGDSTLQ